MLTTTVSKPRRIKAHTTLRPKQENKPALHEAVEVRRCCICGSMSTVDGGDLEITHTLTLDGTSHGLATCSNNAVCIYQAGLLAERLEFRDTDRAPKPRKTLVIDDTHAPIFAAIEQFKRTHEGKGYAFSDAEILDLILMERYLEIQPDTTQY